MRCCYYSPFGGKVQAVLLEHDPALDLQVTQGQLACCDVSEEHSLCAHIDGPAPTVLDGWHATADGLYYRQPGFVASQQGGPPVNITALTEQNARLERELASLRTLIETSLATPGRRAPSRPEA